MSEAGAIWSGGNGRRILNLLTITAVAIFLFILTLKVSVAGVYRNRDAAAALAWFSSDADAKADQAAASLTEEADPDTVERAARMAVEALQRDPTQVAAVRSLAVAAELQGRNAEALRLMRQAERLSRRDLLTQLWFIEHYSRTEDVKATLTHYDIALRTSTRAREILFPILVGATADEALLQPVAELLKQRPAAWWFEFTSELISKGENPDHVARIVTQVLNPRDATEASYLASLIETLVHKRAFPSAWRTYAGVQSRLGGVAYAPRLIRNGDFAQADALPPIDWQYFSDSNVEAQRRLRPNSTSDQVLGISALSDAGGVGARQLLKLPAGRYTLSFEAGDMPELEATRPVVSLACVAGGNAPNAPFMKLSAPRTGSGPARAAQGFVVPAGCEWQWLTVQIGGDAPMPEVIPWIDNVSIKQG
jgi:tetratricopeptide (TPR) repeat protein